MLSSYIFRTKFKLVPKADYDTKIKNIEEKISNRDKLLLILNLINFLVQYLMID